MLQTKMIKYALLVLSLLALLGGVWYGGFQMAFQRQQAVIEQMKADETQARLLAEQSHSAALANALEEQKKWQDFAQDQSAKLAKAHQELDRHAAALEKGINHAIEQDKNASSGHCVDGLGAHGLQLYREALGYANQNH